MLPWGTCDSKVPKEPFSFMEGDNTGTKADRLHAGGALHAKEEVGWGGVGNRLGPTRVPAREFLFLYPLPVTSYYLSLTPPSSFSGIWNLFSTVVSCRRADRVPACPQTALPYAGEPGYEYEYE